VVVYTEGGKGMYTSVDFTSQIAEGGGESHTPIWRGRPLSHKQGGVSYTNLVWLGGTLGCGHVNCTMDMTCVLLPPLTFYFDLNFDAHNFCIRALFEVH
jgi:hypothetical protein